MRFIVRPVLIYIGLIGAIIVFSTDGGNEWRKAIFSFVFLILFEIGLRLTIHEAVDEKISRLEKEIKELKNNL